MRVETCWCFNIVADTEHIKMWAQISNNRWVRVSWCNWRSASKQSDLEKCCPAYKYILLKRSSRLATVGTVVTCDPTLLSFQRVNPFMCSYSTITQAWSSEYEVIQHMLAACAIWLANVRYGNRVKLQRRAPSLTTGSLSCEESWASSKKWFLKKVSVLELYSSQLYTYPI